MRSTPAPPRQYTASEVEEMDDSIAYELDHGELVERNMGSEAGTIGGLIITWLNNFLRGRGPGFTFPSEVTLHIYPGNLSHFRRADVSFVRKDRLPSGHPPKGRLFLAPDLVVEVLSPNDKAVKVERRWPSIWTRASTRMDVFPETRSVVVDGRTAPQRF